MSKKATVPLTIEIEDDETIDSVEDILDILIGNIYRDERIRDVPINYDSEDIVIREEESDD